MSTKRTQKNIRFINKKTGGFFHADQARWPVFGTEKIGKLMLELALPSDPRTDCKCTI